MDDLEPKLVADVPPAPSATPPEPDAILLGFRVEELERRLRARTIELETELKAKERLRERVRELTSRVDGLQETAAALHREAASSTSLARELDETLRVAAEARAQLGAALEAERARRREVEAELSAAGGAGSMRAAELEADLKRLTDERKALRSRADEAEASCARAATDLARAREEVGALAEKAVSMADSARKRDEELAVARRNLAQLRQKTAGHEAHIESLRADLEAATASREQIDAGARAAYSAMSARADKADSELAAARARIEDLSLAMTAAQSSLEQARLLTQRSEDESRRLQTAIDDLQKAFDERQAADDTKSRLALSTAEEVRREGVEAFEKAHEAQLRQEIEGERARKDLSAAMSRVAFESEQLKVKAEKLKQELRARADREVAEMRLALDEERARLYADVEAEREARGKRIAPATEDDPAKNGREIGEARRQEIVKEVESYFNSSPKPLPSAPSGDLPPLFRWDEELRLLLYVAIGVSLAAVVVAGIVLYQG